MAKSSSNSSSSTNKTTNTVDKKKDKNKSKKNNITKKHRAKGSSSVRNSTERSNSSGSTTDSESTSSEEREKKKKVRKKRAGKKKTKSPLSPSVSHPRNRVIAKRSQKKSGAQKGKGSYTLPDHVLPLLIENVTNHTEKVSYSVNKTSNVEAFLETIGTVNGHYTINTEPEIRPIVTPDPSSLIEKINSATNETEAFGSRQSSSDQHVSGSRLLGDSAKRAHQATSGNDEQPENAKNPHFSGPGSYSPLNFDSLQEKFQALVDFGIRTDSKKTYDDEFKQWCEDNSYWDIRKREKFASRQSDRQGDSEKGGAKAKNKHSTKPHPIKKEQKPPKVKDISIKLPTAPGREVSMKPNSRDSGYSTIGTTSQDRSQPQVKAMDETKLRMVSKATSDMQTDEYPAMQPEFEVKEVLMLDSYTQTNDQDRLKTILIKSNQSTANTQTGRDGANENHINSQIDGNQVIDSNRKNNNNNSNNNSNKNKFTNTASQNHSVLQNSLTSNWKSDDNQEESLLKREKESERIPDSLGSRKVKFAVVKMSSDNSSDGNRVESQPDTDSQAGTFKYNNKCRHGNVRGKCVSCNNSVVQRKYKSPLVDKQPKEEVVNPVVEEVPSDITVTAQRQDDSNDSGQDTASPPPPYVSYAKLSKIKRLARAKLRQIKEVDSHVTRSVERLTDNETPSSDSSRSQRAWKQEKPKVHDGIESFTMRSLPPLMNNSWSRTQTMSSESEADSSQVNNTYTNVTVKRVSDLKEQKRLADVKRAKRFIRHCIDTPIAGGRSSDPEVYSHRQRRINSKRAGSLPAINDNRRCGSEAQRRQRSIVDDIESRKCVSEVQSGKLRQFDVNYKAYINALERIVDSNLNSLLRSENYAKK